MAQAAVTPTPVNADVVEDIAKIPGFMRNKGWGNGARLMERWFSGAANSDPKAGPPDLTTLKMDSWVLSFKRAKLVFDDLVTQKIWVNKPAQSEINFLLRKRGLMKGQTLAFGNLNAPLPVIHQEAINFRTVGSLTDPLDDMYAALGRFTFRVAVQGRAVALSQGWRVEIEQVGIYAQDKYDFNGDQPLGYWNFSTGDVIRHWWFGYNYVENKTFRTWRTRHGRGGDFLVFSDMKRLVLRPPNTYVANSL